MIKCSKCKIKLEAKAKFCLECGTKVKAEKELKQYNKCSQCQAKLKPTDKFCLNCGAKVTEKKISSDLKCIKCKAKLKPSDRFCLNCGEKVRKEIEQPIKIVIPSWLIYTGVGIILLIGIFTLIRAFTDSISCQPPYMLSGKTCCLDQNNNSV